MVKQILKVLMVLMLEAEYELWSFKIKHDALLLKM